MKTLRPSSRTKILVLSSIVLLAAGVGITWYAMHLHTQKGPDTGGIYLEVPAQAARKGKEISFALHINSRVAVDAVTATLRYNSDQLKYKDTTYDTGAFDSNLPGIVKDTTVKLQAAKLGGTTVKGDVLVAHITFTALISGNVDVALIAGNAAHAGVATNPSVELKRMRS